MDLSETAHPLQITIRPPVKNAPVAPPAFWSGATPGFTDILDTINPLQHIPVVASAYQAATGDIPSTAAKLLGGALFGGPIGFVVSLFDTLIEQSTGATVMENLVAAATGRDVPALHPKPGSPTETQMAANAPPDHLSANQRAGYNAYLQSQSLLA